MDERFAAAVGTETIVRAEAACAARDDGAGRYD